MFYCLTRIEQKIFHSGSVKDLSKVIVNYKCKVSRLFASCTVFSQQAKMLCLYWTLS